MKFIPGFTPAEWLEHVTRGDCKTCQRLKPPRGVTRWYSGDIKPVRVGWYERISTLGTGRNYWSGRRWEQWEGVRPSFHQAGDYPAWRGVTEAAFKRGTA